MTALILPPGITRETYRQIFRDDGAWLPAVRAICERHGLPTAHLARSAQGSHIVFYVAES